jgi:tellurite resistance protein TerC
VAVMRFVFILAGVGLLERFHHLRLRAVPVVTGIKMTLPKKEEFEPEKNIVLRLFRRFYPVSPHLGSRAFLYGAPRAAA